MNYGTNRAQGRAGTRRALPHQFFDWERALSALGSKIPENAALPLFLDCPLCHGRMGVYPDMLGGVWLDCRGQGCEYNGEIVELGMRLWQLGAAAALNKFNDFCVPTNPRSIQPRRLSYFEEKFLPYRKRLRALWAASAKAQFQDNREILQLHDQFGLPGTRSLDRWYSGLGRFIGTGFSREYVRALYQTNEQRCIFTGPNWKDVIVIPVHDVPGRICAFWFIGRQGRPKLDYYYHRVNLGPGTYFASPTIEESESGIAFMDAAAPYNARFGDTAFAVSDLEVALRVHGRHFRDNSDVLPLVLTHESTAMGRSRKVWNFMPGKQWVFWAPKLSPEVVAQAREAGGRILIEPADEYALRSPLAWLDRLQTKAKPWKEVLAKEAKRLEDPELEPILRILKCDRLEDWHSFLEVCPKSAIPRLKSLHTASFPIKTLQVGVHRIQERPEGWVFELSGELISNVIVRITETVRTVNCPTSGNVLVTQCKYRGYYLVNGHRVPFCYPLTKFRKYTVSFIENALIAAGLGAPRIGVFWGRRLVDIALKFHVPKQTTQEYQAPVAEELPKK